MDLCLVRNCFQNITYLIFFLVISEQIESENSKIEQFSHKVTSINGLRNVALFRVFELDFGAVQKYLSGISKIQTIALVKR